MNEQQLAAAHAPNGYLQIIAGPGTGKTFTLVQRIVELVSKGIEPARIIVVTFTRAAAREILERVNSCVGTKTALIIGTFHSVALRLLRRYGGDTYRNISVVDEHDKADVLRKLSGVNGPDIRRLSKEISSIKSKRELDIPDPELGQIYEQYEKHLALLNKVDFDSLLLRFRSFLESSDLVQNNVDAVLVDEFQDTSLIQLDIAMLLAQRCANMTIVGDPDQSIYGFRNADPRNFMEMAKQVETQKCYLEKNYRSEQSILTAASRVINESKTRYAGDRVLLAAKPQTRAEVQFVRSMSPNDEACRIVSTIQCLIDSGLHPKEVSVLSRYSNKLQNVEAALTAGGIAIKMMGGKRLAEQKEVRLIIDYLRVVISDSDSLAIERTVNQPRRGLGEKTLQRARNQHGFLTLNGIRGLATESSSEYINLVETVRKAIKPTPSQDKLAVVQQAHAVLDELAHTVLPSASDRESGAAHHLEVMKGALDQFYEIYMDRDEEDERTFLEAFVDQWSLGADINPTPSNAETGQVTLSTIHSAKGLEWPVVFMLDVSDDDTLGNLQRSVEEDRRLLYVAMTRAKSLLVVSSSDVKSGFNKLLLAPKQDVQTEISIPDLESLSACIGRELKLKEASAPKRSVLSKSRRFKADAPVELPPGFQLASELPQAPPRPASTPKSTQRPPLRSALPRSQEHRKIAKVSQRKAPATLIDFFSKRPR